MGGGGGMTWDYLLTSQHCWQRKDMERMGSTRLALDIVYSRGANTFLG